MGWIVTNKKRTIVFKEYPYKLQAIIWCFMNGYAYSGFDEWKHGRERLYILDPRIEIVEVK